MHLTLRFIQHCWSWPTQRSGFTLLLFVQVVPALFKSYSIKPVSRPQSSLVRGRTWRHPLSWSERRAVSLGSSETAARLPRYARLGLGAKLHLDQPEQGSNCHSIFSTTSWALFQNQASPFYVLSFILGSGCSGKTTFLKQLRIVYDNGYTEKERKAFKPIIYRNIRRAMVRIIEGMEEIGLTFESEELKTKVGSLKRISKKEICPKDYQRLWI